MEKKIVSSAKMTFMFIWHFALYTLLLTLITGFIYSLIEDKVNIIVMNVIILILSGISIFLATKLSVKDIFSDNRLKEENKKKYKRNIIIFFIIIIIFTIIYYALIYLVSVIKIDTMVDTLVIADNQDITGVIEQAKNIQLGITCVSAVVKSFIYAGMVKYQDKYINKNN